MFKLFCVCFRIYKFIPLFFVILPFHADARFVELTTQFRPCHDFFSIICKSWHWHWNWYYKRQYLLFHNAYGPQEWWLMMKRPHQQSHVVTWQIKSVMSPLSLVIWTPNVAGWWLKMREHHALWSRDHVTNNKTLYLHFHKAHGPQT